MRQCTACGEAKEPLEFRGPRKQCRQCERDYKQAWRGANPEMVKAHNRKTSAKYVLAGDLKKRVRTKVQTALRNGTIARPDTCQSCGTTCTPEGHHHDYGAPLSVTWLCQACHVKAHGGTIRCSRFP